MWFLCNFSMCGFDNALVFKNMSDEDIDYVEEFTKKEHFDQYFHRGHRKMLKEIVHHVKNVVDGKGVNTGLNYFSTISLEHEKRIENVSNQIENQDHKTRTHYFLNKLVSTANQNVTRKKGGFRYDNDIKFFATYLRMIAGPLAYKTIQQNLVLSLPSLPSTNRYIHSTNCHIIEGVLRADELYTYLTERNLPLVVCLSEDATRIVDKTQYNPSTNQISGFVAPLKENGMPVAFNYPARNAEEIAQHFLNENSVSTFVNIIIAQPLGDVSPFCLLVFGSDNKYTADQVKKRWLYIKAELNKRNIMVLTISSDSDPRYNSAMHELSLLGCRTNNDYFACGDNLNCEIDTFFFQDSYHLFTKLRNFFLKTLNNKKKIPFGPKYFVQLDHLYVLLDKFSKDKHNLTASTLNPNDKQNLNSVLRMFDLKVIDLLKNNVKNSEATVLFLTIVRDLIDSHMDTDLSLLQMIQKIWFPVFVVRIWRDYIVSNKVYKLKDNFLSTNCYKCVELDAHSLVLVMLYLKKIGKPEWFQPHLFSSQPCEATFRLVRSLSSTYSTITNCSIKEFLERISKIQLQADIAHRTAHDFIYPRTKQIKRSSKQKCHDLPSEDEIFAEIEIAKKRAIEACLKLGLKASKAYAKSNYSLKIDPFLSKAKKKIKNKLLTLKPINRFKNINLNNIALKNYADKQNISESSPYVEIPNSNKKTVVRKTSLCWLLRSECVKLSSDRLLRVMTYNKKVYKAKKQNLNHKKIYSYFFNNKKRFTNKN